MTMDHGMKNDLMEALKEQEGFRSEPYKCSEGYLTIGFGRNLDTVGIARHEAKMLLENDLTKAYSTLVSNMPWVHDLPKPAQAALTNMCFQLGYGGLSKFKKMLAALQEGDYEKACAEAYNSRWAQQTPSRADHVAHLFRKCKV